MKKFTKYILQIITGIGATLSLCAGRAMAFTAADGAEAARADGMPADLVGPDGIFNQITSVALGVIGAVSVIMLIWGGLRYIISGGDSKKITDAKNTILYAIIGLIIAVLSYAIIRFVLNSISTVSLPEDTAAIILNYLA